jgi:hypothetical protein
MVEPRILRASTVLLVAWKGRQILSESLSLPIQNTIILYDTRFLFSTSSRLVLGPTQPPIQWVQGGSFPGGRAAWT